MEKRILAADIGGTNSRFASFSLKKDALEINERKWINTTSVSSLGELFDALGKSGFHLTPRDADIVALAVAGPVERGAYSNPPWISWDINLENANREFGIKRYLLINDFVAQAYACRSYVGESAELVISGENNASGTVAVIGAGTGLGKAMLVPVPILGSPRLRYLAVPSEGGHAAFPIETRRESDFLEFLCDKLQAPYATCESVVSGKGISYVHEFLTGAALEPSQIAEQWKRLPVDSRESETLLWCTRFFGRVCRNFALETLAYGGLYIAGGVVAKNPILAKHQAFAEAFHSSPRHQELLAKIPVRVIHDEESGLWGAAVAGAQEIT